MPLHESMFGDETRRPVNSALSGKPLDFSAGDVAFTIKGYRVGIKALEFRQATPAEIEAAKAIWADQLPDAKPAATAIAEVDYEASSFEDLKQLAKERSIEMSGRPSKESLISALRLADLQARVSAAPTPSETEVSAGSDFPGMIGE